MRETMTERLDRLRTEDSNLLRALEKKRKALQRKQKKLRPPE